MVPSPSWRPFYPCRAAGGSAKRSRGAREGTRTIVSQARIHAYPWHSLEAMSHADVAARSAVARWIDCRISAERFASALGALIGAKVTVLGMRTKLLLAAPGPTPDAIGFSFGVVDAAEVERA